MIRASCKALLSCNEYSIKLLYKSSSSLTYHVELFNNYQLVELKLNDKIVLTFKDTMNHNSDLSCFTRVIKNQEYIFDNGKLLIKKIIKNVSFLLLGSVESVISTLVVDELADHSP